MVCAYLLCELSVLADDIQEQSVDENQAPTWCKRGIHAAQLGIQMFAQLRTVPEAKFLDPLPAGAPAMSTQAGCLCLILCPAAQ
ncbi:hypothetical protein WJX82_004570 [Trebouxia sp. C0006]